MQLKNWNFLSNNVIKNVIQMNFRHINERLHIASWTFNLKNFLLRIIMLLKSYKRFLQLSPIYEFIITKYSEAFDCCEILMSFLLSLKYFITHFSHQYHFFSYKSHFSQLVKALFHNTMCSAYMQVLWIRNKIFVKLMIKKHFSLISSVILLCNCGIKFY